MVEQSGGKFIGQGSVGCVFFKHVQCQDGTEMPGCVGKVFESVSEATQEEMLHSKVADILDPERLFTVRLYTKCKISANHFKHSDNPNLCSFTKRLDKNRTYTQLLYEHGGKNMEQMIRLLKTGRTSILSVVSAMEHIMFGIVSLAIHGYVHMDITHRNVLYRSAINNTSLIDFGLLKQADEVYHSDSLHYKYVWYPPEFKIASLLSNIANIDYETFLMHYASNFTSRYVSFEAFQAIHGKDVLDRQLRRFFNKIQAITTGKKGLVNQNSAKTSTDINFRHLQSPSFKNIRVALKLLQQFTNKVDVYSVGILWFYLLETSHHTEKLGYGMRELVKGMTCTDPQRRWDPLTAYNRYASFLMDNNMTPILSKHPMITNGHKLLSLRSKTHAELKAMCAKAQITVVGTKKDLIERLVKTIM